MTLDDTLVPQLSGHEEDRRPLQIALLTAILIHIILLYIALPQGSAIQPPPPRADVRLTEWKILPPPPPQPPRRPQERILRARVLPIPDPTPQELEPIRDPVEQLDVVTPGLVPILGFPPRLDTRTGGPRTAGVDNVSEPVRSLYVIPRYPTIARQAGIQAMVFVQALISEDGQVIDVTVLSSTAPNLGFEDAAIEAVRQWRYEPGEQNGQPVSVYFNVVVNFTIH